MVITLILTALMINQVIAESFYYDLVPIDMKELAKNPAELLNFMDCLLDRGPCNDIYKGYREDTPESVRQACRRCTTEQKIFVYLFLLTLKTILPEEYKNFRNKYDPDNIYFDKLEEEVGKFTFAAFAS
nr:ejaculatory bulb-specific protein 3-like [Danaus plexippus plexippus]